MMWMKKCIFKTSFLFLLLPHLLASCGNSGDDNGGTQPGETVKTGRVKFVNESSYSVKVHRDAFSGPVVCEFSGFESPWVDVRISDTSFGTTFSVEYLYRINDAFDADSGEVFASGLDFNVQINFVIEEGRSYTKQIPQPANLEFRSAFIKLLNAHNLPCELRDYGRILSQTGNGVIPIAPGKTGVYKLSGIPAEGELYEGYKVVSTFAETPVPELSIKNAEIWNLKYDGESVTIINYQTIIFK